jgi:hypothetical protein
MTAQVRAQVTTEVIAPARVAYTTGKRRQAEIERTQALLKARKRIALTSTTASSDYDIGRG